MDAEESRKKKKKTTYKANDGNLSLTVLGEIISFVTLFFLNFFFLFSFCFTCFLQSLLDQHIRREQCASQFEPSVFPFVYSLFTSLLVTIFFLPGFFVFFFLLLLLSFRSCLFLSIRCNIFVAFLLFVCFFVLVTFVYKLIDPPFFPPYHFIPPSCIAFPLCVGSRSHL